MVTVKYLDYDVASVSFHHTGPCIRVFVSQTTATAACVFLQCFGDSIEDFILDASKLT